MKSEKKNTAKYKGCFKADNKGIDFLNNISAGYTSLIQVYRCYKILNRNYLYIAGECRVKLV